jgi:hypothetical protein
MSPRQERSAFIKRSRRWGGSIITTLGSTLGGWLGLPDRISAAKVRRMRRELRHWLEAHGLTIMMVSLMMVVAWMIASR